MKRIVVDARTVVDNVDGIGYYSIYFIKRLVHCFGGQCQIYVILPMKRSDISVFTPEERKHLRLAFSPQDAFGQNHKFDYEAWDEFVARLRPDIYISTAFFPTRYEGQKAVIIHDLIPLLFREESEAAQDGRVAMFERILREAALDSDLLIGVSQHTAKDICDYYPNRRAEVKILHPDVAYTVDRIERGLGKEVSQHGRFLMIGVNRPRKNTELVIEALKILKTQGHTDCKVYFAGGIDEELVPLPGYIAENGLEDMAEALGYVSDEQMSALIQGSIGMLYPSAYEGFGMPLIEAMVARKPIICQRISSLPEVGGEIPHYCTGDPQEMAELMLAIHQGTAPLRDEAAVVAQLDKLIQRNARQYDDLFAWIERRLHAPLLALPYTRDGISFLEWSDRDHLPSA